MEVQELSAKQLREMLAKKEAEERSDMLQRQRDYEREKEAFVIDAVAKFKDFNEALSIFKSYLLKRGNELHDKMWEVYGKEAKDLKQFSLQNSDKNLKLVIERQEKLQFDESAEVAIGIIKDVLKSKFEGRNKAMYNIIDGVLMKNKKGDYDERLVTKLRKYEGDVNSEEFSKALDILAKSYNTTGSSTYARAYILNEANSKMEDVCIQFSSL